MQVGEEVEVCENLGLTGNTDIFLGSDCSLTENILTMSFVTVAEWLMKVT